MKQMLDSEQRLAGAKFFLDCARKTDINQPEYKWYIQATASFAIAAIEILRFDYGEKHGLFPRHSKLWPGQMKDKYPKDPFFPWLDKKLEMNTPDDQKSPDGIRYAFLREERHSILHKGQRDKRKIEIRQPLGAGKSSVTVAYFFIGWDSEPSEITCENAIAFAESIIAEAKNLGYI